MNPIEDGAERPRTSGGTIGFAAALVILAVIIALLLFARPPQPPAGSGQAPPAAPAAKVGSAKHIGSAAAQGIACVSTRPKLDDVIKSGTAGDLARVRDDIADAAILHTGDAVQILERFGPNGKYAKLEVVSGGAVGRVCFTEIDVADFLK